MKRDEPNFPSARPLLALAALAVVGSAQTSEPTLRDPRPPARIGAEIHAGQDPSRIVLKLADDCGVRVERAQLALGLDAAPEAIAPCAYLAGLDVPAARLVPMEERALGAMRRIGQENTGERLADLAQYYVLELPSGVDALAVLHELNAMDAVEEAYAAPRVAPAPFLPGTTPSFTQGYRGSAPSGVDADYAETIPGGDGDGITVCDVEYGWNVAGVSGNGHEDLQTLSSQTGPAPPVGNPAGWIVPGSGTPNPEVSHGTAVMGVLTGDDNGLGVKGLARGATVRLRGTITSYGGYSVAAAILHASSKLVAGDVILVEQQAFGPNWDGNPQSQFGLVPVELYQAEFDAIRQVTALGIHVIEAAGNGSQNLDDYTQGTPGTATGHPWYVYFHFSVRNSRAVMVGAANPSASFSRESFSNYGFRIDTFSWGRDIHTLGYGDAFDGGGNEPDLDRLYTNVFGGTSGASAIVASAATCLAGIHRARQRRMPLQPEALRWLLRTTGTAPLSLTPHSGRHPDLRAQSAILAQGRDPSVAFDGNGSSGFSSAFAVIGDMNGDGFADVVTGSPSITVSPGPIFGAGMLQVWSGIDGVEILSRRTFGTQQNEDLGRAVAAIGDANSDGFADYLVSAAGANSARGRVLAIDGQTGATLYVVNGDNPNDSLGWSLANAGDVNGNGTQDFVAGAWGAGYARVYEGTSGSLIHTLTGPGSGLAWSVAGAGDVDNDGFDDVLVGSWTGDIAYVFSGQTGSALYGGAFTADTAGDRFGYSVTGLGDLDGDSHADFAIGAPRDDDGGMDAGSVKIYSGQTGNVLRRFDGTAAGDELGTSVAGLGDMNGDGTPDVAMGAPYSDVTAGNAGFVFVRSGKTWAPIWTYRGEKAGDRFGNTIFSAGDWNGDGRPDLAVGAPNGNTFSSGRILTFLAPPPVTLRAGWLLQ